MAACMVEGGSYPAEGALISLDELCCLRVLHVNADRDTMCGEMICNKAIAADLLDIFRELYHQSYPIERMVPIDEYGADDEQSMRANNSSSFCYRVIAGSTRLSKHASGMAVDLNPLYNPYVKTSNGKTVIQPSTAGPYVNRKADFPYKIDVNDEAYKQFVAHGFTWGGAWTSLKDYQHFEK
ncbi:MAG: M15 family metallopeptidase [Bacteroidales bacterium]|nr:M15 family metallopeptidase [Bacteroidales bacterium]